MVKFMICKICKHENNFIFKGLVLNKYQVDYFKCPNCDFIQTEKPFWLDESYCNAITDLDIGLVSRNLIYSSIIDEILKSNFDYNGKFLDYAGGYGLFVRLMRDRGFNFYREDKYCENIFARYYDFKDIHISNKFEILTAFELFEHLENPFKEIKKMLKYSDTIIFSTELQPKKEIKSSDDWWYFTLETGQHIAFFTEKTMEYIAKELNCTYFSNNNLHLLSNRKFIDNPLLVKNYDINSNIVKMDSLIQADFEFAKNVAVKINEIKRDFCHTNNDIEIKNYINKLSLCNTRLDSLEIELESTKKEINYMKELLNETNEELSITKTQLDSRINELNTIYYSRGWKLVVFIRRIINILIPKESLRRKVISSLYNFFKKYVKMVLRMKGTILGGFQKFKNYFFKLKPRKKRKINLASKKVVYIGHSFHDKTKSTAFLIDYLKQFFDVEVILDDSWNGKPFPDLSFIDESYLGVIFFQLLPNNSIIKNIKNDNIIYFPMYDGVRRDYEFWNQHRNLKIMNFSDNLHNRLKKWGLDSIYIQYFPKPDKFIPGEINDVFFWQRLSQININTITKLFKNNNFQIHLHKAVDPGQEFIKPSENIEKKFQITYSDWFKTKEEMWNVIKQKGIYIAPREYEGIGMSFLEAMAMGKAVIAVDNPTMNEYIKNGVNGYLFNFKNPKEIDLSNIKQVQKNTYEYMKNGYKDWETNKIRIINFIKKL